MSRLLFHLLRSSAALAVLFTATSALSDDARPKRLLLIGQGPDGHPPGTHEFMPGVRIIESLLSKVDGIRTKAVKADEPWTEGPDLIDKADGIVMFVTQGAQWMQLDPKRHAAVKRLAQRKGAIVALHWAVGAKDAQYIEGQLEVLGGTRGGPQRKYKVLEVDLKIADPSHPITAGLKDFRIFDEMYYRLDFVKPPRKVHPILKTEIDGHVETVCWAWERPDGGRSFGFVGLHFHENWKRPEYRRLVTQAILWTLGQPVPQGGVSLDLPDPSLLELK